MKFLVSVCKIIKQSACYLLIIFSFRIKCFKSKMKVVLKFWEYWYCYFMCYTNMMSSLHCTMTVFQLYKENIITFSCNTIPILLLPCFKCWFSNTIWFSLHMYIVGYTCAFRGSIAGVFFGLHCCNWGVEPYVCQVIRKSY